MTETVILHFGMNGIGEEIHKRLDNLIKKWK